MCVTLTDMSEHKAIHVWQACRWCHALPRQSAWHWSSASRATGQESRVCGLGRSLDIHPQICFGKLTFVNGKLTFVTFTEEGRFEETHSIHNIHLEAQTVSCGRVLIEWF